MIDLSAIERELTHSIWRELEDGAGSLHILLTISGTTASETISDLTTYEENPKEKETLYNRYVSKLTFDLFLSPITISMITIVMLLIGNTVGTLQTSFMHIHTVGSINYQLPIYFMILRKRNRRRYYDQVLRVKTSSSNEGNAFQKLQFIPFLGNSMEKISLNSHTLLLC